MKRMLMEIFGTSGIPFMLMSANGGIKVNYARVMEAIIIAAVSGMMAAYVTVSELKIKLAYMEGQSTRLEEQVKQTCELIQVQMREITRIDTLQKERLERERKIGVK
jgi:uncharacterized protein YqgV (UPF0045/DUF77 family)